MATYVTIETSNYEAAHGKTPRGWGMWGFDHSFEIEGRGWTTLSNADSDGFVWVTGTYTEAKKEVVKMVRQEAKEIGGKLVSIFVEVLS